MRSSAATRTRSVALSFPLVFAGACSRTPEAKPDAPRPAERTASAAAAAAPKPAPLASGGASYRLPARARLVAIGDIHGDLTALRRALQLAGATDSDDRWIGKDLTVVQTGDQVDRGDQDRQVLDVLESIEASAKAAGGALYVLNGNHELMNAALDFRYVTRKSFASFDDFSSSASRLAGHVPEAELGRAAAFMPGAAYALKLSRHLTVALVGDSLFAHGGVLPAHVDYGLDRINREASAFLAGQTPQLPAILMDESGPVWMRDYGRPDVGDATCEALGRVLAQVGAKRLIVGHTVQERGITSACGERLFRIDIGLSAFYGVKPAQVLEVTAGGTRILSAAEPSKGRDSALHSSP